MDTIYISVKLKFTIKELPLNMCEIFLAINQLMKQLGKRLAIEFLKRLEQRAASELKSQGYVRHSYQKRTFQGVLGKVSLKLLKVKPAVGKLRYALADKVQLPAYVRNTDDAFESGLGLLPHLSYKRSSVEARRIQGSGPAKSSLHRKLKACAAQVEVHPEGKAGGYRYVVADGTGARFQRRRGRKHRRGISYSGALRMVYASKGVGQPFEVIGRWTNSSWKHIAREVYRRIDPQDVKILISDGGPGIEEAFVKPHMKHQRCSVHVWRDLRAFLYQDGVKKHGQRQFYQFLHQVPAFAYAKKKTMETLRAEDTQAVQQHVAASEKQLVELQQVLQGKGYHKTATYIANLSEPLLTFLKQWLATSELSPATSNIAESRFSLIKNRIARIGRRWSEPGLQRWIDLAIHKLFPGYGWDILWHKLLPVSGNLICEIVKVY
jgi:hypothetical protein